MKAMSLGAQRSVAFLFILANLLPPFAFAQTTPASLAASSTSASAVPVPTPAQLDLWSPIVEGTPKKDIQQIADRLAALVVETGSNLAYWRLLMIERKFGVHATGDRHAIVPGTMTFSNAAFLGSPESVIFDTAALPDHAAILTKASSSAVTSEDAFTRSVPLESVVPIDVSGHLWVLADARSDVSIPDIFSAAPADMPVLYLRDLAALRVLDGAWNTLGAFPAAVSPVWARWNGPYAKLMDALGVVDPEKLGSASREALLVAEDLSFTVGTNIALVIAPKGEISDIEAALRSGVGARGTAGPYYVLATSEGLRARITKTIAGTAETPALLREVDFRFAYGATGPTREAFVFLSERAMRRFLSPGTFINTARRARVAMRLSALQYAVLAYRSVTGSMPSSLNDLVSSGYLADPKSTPEDPEFAATWDEYTIDASGVLHHKEWGTLNDLAAVTDVSVATVSPVEGAIYERLRSDPAVARVKEFAPFAASVAVGKNVVVDVFLPHGAPGTALGTLEDMFGGTPKKLMLPEKLPSAVPVALFGTFDVERFLIDAQSGAGLRFPHPVGERDEEMAAAIAAWERAAIAAAQARKGVSTASTECARGFFADVALTRARKDIEAIFGTTTAACIADREHALVAIYDATAGAYLCISGEPAGYRQTLPIAARCEPEIGFMAAREALRKQEAEQWNILSRDGKRVRAAEALNGLLRESGVTQHIDPYTLFGGEFGFGIMGSSPYSGALSGLDGYVVATIQDPSAFVQLFRELYMGLARTWGGVAEPKEPEDGKEETIAYTAFPSASATLYLITDPDRAYATWSEAARRGIAQAIADGHAESLSERQRSLVGSVGTERNLLGVVEPQEASAYFHGFTTDPTQWADLLSVPSPRDMGGYFSDINALRSVFGPDDALFDKLFAHIPRSYLGLPVTIGKEGVALGAFLVSWKDVGKASLGKLATNEEGETLYRELAKVGGVAVGISFIPEGARVAFAFPNPTSWVPSVGESTEVSSEAPWFSWSSVWYALAMIVLALALWFGYRLIRKHKGDRTIAEIMAEQMEKK